MYVWQRQWELLGYPEYERTDEVELTDLWLRKHMDDVLGQLKDLFVEDAQYRKGNS
jgi:hypothetical protein